MKENKKKEVQGKKEDNTYLSEGMLYGVAVGSLIGAIIARVTSTTYFPMCLSVGMMLGLAIGSNIKKEK